MVHTMAGKVQINMSPGIIRDSLVRYVSVVTALFRLAMIDDQQKPLQSPDFCSAGD
jgi:hypothetical protein